MNASPPKALRWLRWPLLHFLLLGGGLYLLVSRPGDQGKQAAEAGAPVVSAARLAQLEADAVLHLARPLTAEERAAIRQEAIDDELLFYHALAAGLDRHLPGVVERLASLLRFAGEDGSADGRSELELELLRRDAVARGTLVDAMRQQLAGPANPPDPGDEALAAMLAAEADRFRPPLEVRFTQVFFDPSRRRDATEREALEWRQSLIDRRQGPKAGLQISDPSPIAHEIGPATREQVARVLGAKVANAAFELSPGTWSEPIRSNYGFHLLWIEDRHAGDNLSLRDLRPEVLLLWRQREREKAFAAGLAELAASTPVRVEEPPASQEGVAR